MMKAVVKAEAEPGLGLEEVLFLKCAAMTCLFVS
jgi:hypothetical protein